MVATTERDQYLQKADQFIRRLQTDPSFLDEYRYRRIRRTPHLSTSQRAETTPMPTRRTMNGILQALSSASFDPTREYYKFEIAGMIEPTDLQAFVQLPYEVLSSGLVLITGTKRRVTLDEEVKESVQRTGVLVHSHHMLELEPPNEPQANVPSFEDIIVTASLPASTTHVIACKYGLIHYGRPRFNPITKEELDETECGDSGKVEKLVNLYCMKKGVDATGDSSGYHLTSIDDLNYKQLLSLIRQFAEDTKSIRSEVAWEDRVGINRIMRLINQQAIAEGEEGTKAREQLRNPYHLPSKASVYNAFGGVNEGGHFRLSGLWWDYVLDPSNPRYEVLTSEFITALSDYLAERANQYGGTTENPLTILEVGAGDGRLSHFLKTHLDSRTPGIFQVVATDNGSDQNIQRHFPVEMIAYSEAVKTYQPSVVISSWMPLGRNWTGDLVVAPSVRETILIGHEDVCGTPEAWGYGLEQRGGHERFELEEIEKYQIGRIYCPSTVSIRRTT